MRRLALRNLFIALTIVTLLPVWAVRYLPTSDGPSHLYNASILLRLAGGERGEISDIYVIDSHPNPNWLGHLILALLLIAFPAFLAEKLLVSGIVILFLYGGWKLAARSPAYAFLLFPLAFHQSLQFGYYNFSIATGLFLVTVALWWERRERPTPKNIAIVAGLLLLSYSSHPMPTALAIGTIGLLWLTTRRDFRHLLALVPASGMLFWYYTTQTATAKAPSPKYLIEYMFKGRYALTFDERQAWFGSALVILYLLLAIATLVKSPREGWPFAAVLAVFLILYFLAPAAAAGGLGVNERIGFFLFLLPLAWFSPALPETWKTALVALMTIVALANTVFLLTRYKQADRIIKEIVRTFDAAQPGKAFVPLLFDTRPPRSIFEYLAHSHDYASAERKLIDVANYEAELGYFPIRYRSGYPFIYSSTIHPAGFPASAYAGRADYIFTWKMPSKSKSKPQIEERYVLVREWGLGRLYGRR